MYEEIVKAWEEEHADAWAKYEVGLYWTSQQKIFKKLAKNTWQQKSNVL